jgi:PAS domain S-box-containing protein
MSAYRNLLSSVVFALCNAGEALLAAGLIDQSSVHPPIAAGKRTWRHFSFVPCVDGSGLARGIALANKLARMAWAMMATGARYNYLLAPPSSLSPLCAYVLAALFAERRQHEAALSESEARLQEALAAGAVTTFVWDAVTGSTQRSANAAQILGFDPQQPFTASNFLSHVHPDDREHLKAILRAVSPERQAYTTTFRFRHPDGRELWLEEKAVGEFDDVGGLARLKGLTLDASARKQSENQQRVLITALEHRVRDLLSRVAVVAKDTRKSGASFDEYIQALDRRIQSMADAHTLLSQSHWEGAGLADLICRQLAPDGTDANTTVSGPDVMLTVAAAQTLAMVLHELVTNAAKYGALSTPHGRVEVSWRTGQDAASFLMVWREIGGPPIATPPKCKYGVSIIRDLIPRELGGTVDLSFTPDGVCCQLEIPVEATRAAPGRPAVHLWQRS